MAIEGIIIGGGMCNNVAWSHKKALKAGIELPSDGANLPDSLSAVDFKDCNLNKWLSSPQNTQTGECCPIFEEFQWRGMPPKFLKTYENVVEEHLAMFLPSFFCYVPPWGIDALLELGSLTMTWPTYSMWH